MQDTESAAAYARHCNQSILPFPLLPWINLVPLPYPQHQACFQKIPSLLHKDGDPRPRNWYAAGACMTSSRWEPRNPGSNNEINVHTSMYKFILLCTPIYYMNVLSMVCTGMYRYVLVCTCMYLYILILSSYRKCNSPCLETWEFILVCNVLWNHAIVYEGLNRLIPMCPGV